MRDGQEADQIYWEEVVSNKTQISEAQLLQKLLAKNDESVDMTGSDEQIEDQIASEANFLFRRRRSAPPPPYVFLLVANSFFIDHHRMPSFLLILL